MKVRRIGYQGHGLRKMKRVKLKLIHETACF
jgi:hypothetical protein